MLPVRLFRRHIAPSYHSGRRMLSVSVDIDRLLREGPSIADKLSDGTIDISPPMLSESVMNLCAEKKYKHVIDVHSWVPPTHSHYSSQLSYAAMIAYSGMHQSSKVRKLVKAYEYHLDLRTSATLLIAAYCYSNRLQSAENLLMTWLQCLPPSSNLDNLIDGIKGGRNLDFKGSSKEISLSPWGKGGSNDAVGVPGMRVWHSMMYMYSIRGAWKQCFAILRFLEGEEKALVTQGFRTIPGVRYPVHLDNVAYHRAIVSLCDALAFPTAIELYDEVHCKSITPHPRSLAHFIRVLSLWDGVETDEAMMSICNKAIQVILTLKHTNDEKFAAVHDPRGSYRDWTVLGEVEEDPSYFPLLDAGIRDRRKTIDEMISQMLRSLAVDRGLNVFANGITQRLKDNGLHIPDEGLFALLEGKCRANKWKDAVPIYNELKSRGVPVRDTMAYHLVADAMIRENAKSELARFVVDQHT